MARAPSVSPAEQLDGFIARYAPEIAARARDVLTAMRARLPGAVELVYDNYNALVVGFGPTERVSDAVFSIALYPRWINLYFLNGAQLPDPDGVLVGAGKQVRRVLLEGVHTLDLPAVQRVMAIAMDAAQTPFDSRAPGRVVIKSISAKQRPRLPENDT